jgi:hypothetical protein
MRKIIALALVLLVGMLLWRFVWQKAPQPERSAMEAKISAQRMASSRFPGVTLEFAPEFKYAGGQLFRQREAADVEQHFWVEADEHKTIRRMFWIQHQGFLANNDFTYESDEDPQFDYGGLRWLRAEGLQSPPLEEVDPESDFARMRTYLRAKGYNLPNTWMRLRLLTTDQQFRHQFMIWFMEDRELIAVKKDSQSKEGETNNSHLKTDWEHPEWMLDWDIEKRMEDRVKLSRATSSLSPGPSTAVR